MARIRPAGLVKSASCRSQVDQSNQDDDGAQAIAFGCGLVMGAALALLLAPASGRDTRAWVAERGRSAGRGTSALLNRTRAIAIVREEGVRGLWHRLRRDQVPTPPPARVPAAADLL